jgi:hypothetical protein
MSGGQMVARQRSGRKWPAEVTEKAASSTSERTSSSRSAKRIVASLKRSAEHSRRRKAELVSRNSMQSEAIHMQSDTVQAAKSVKTNKTSRLISSEKVDGAAVYNGVGLHPGAIHHLMIDKFSGHVEYAVMSFEWRDRQCDLIVA